MCRLHPAHQTAPQIGGPGKHRCSHRLLHAAPAAETCRVHMPTCSSCRLSKLERRPPLHHVLLMPDKLGQPTTDRGPLGEEKGEGWVPTRRPALLEPSLCSSARAANTACSRHATCTPIQVKTHTCGG